MLNCEPCGFEYQIFNTVIDNARRSSYLYYISINAAGSLSIFPFKQLMLKYKGGKMCLALNDCSVKLTYCIPRKNSSLGAEYQVVWGFFLPLFCNYNQWGLILSALLPPAFSEYPQGSNKWPLKLRCLDCVKARKCSLWNKVKVNFILEHSSNWNTETHS